MDDGQYSCLEHAIKLESNSLPLPRVNRRALRRRCGCLHSSTTSRRVLSAMGKRRRAQPVVAVVKSRKRARQIVTAFHKAEEQLAALDNGAELDSGAKAERAKELQGSLEQLGGRAAYQAASQLSVSFFNTSKWVMGRMVEMGLKPAAGKAPLRVLEVGAINTALLDCPWLEVTAIDLLARHERIRQQDFFALSASLRFDAMVSSMVLNSVPSARARGEMLRRCHDYLHRDSGHLFLMLPRSCLTHSRRLTLQGFKRRVLPHFGFRLVKEHATPKVAFFVLQAVERKDGAGKEENAAGGGRGGGDSSWAKDFAIELV